VTYSVNDKKCIIDWNYVFKAFQILTVLILAVAVTHNCIIATVQLYHPSGQEAKNRLQLNTCSSFIVSNMDFYAVLKQCLEYCGNILHTLYCLFLCTCVLAFGVTK